MGLLPRRRLQTTLERGHSRVGGAGRRGSRSLAKRLILYTELPCEVHLKNTCSSSRAEHTNTLEVPSSHARQRRDREPPDLALVPDPLVRACINRDSVCEIIRIVSAELRCSVGPVRSRWSAKPELCWSLERSSVFFSLNRAQL